MANKQTEATKRYHQKIGIINKSFALDKTLCDDFKKACEKSGTSQRAEIAKFMQAFIDNSYKR